MKILIIEEDYIIREPIKIILQNKKHEVLTALDNETGMKVITDNPNLNLVIISLDMSKAMNGIDVLREMNRTCHTATKWLMSGTMTKEIAITAKSLGAELAMDKHEIWKNLKESGLIK